MGEYGITCNAVRPDYVDTNTGAQDSKIEDYHKKTIAKISSKRLVSTREVSGLVKYLLQVKSPFINGSVLTIDGGLSCHAGI